MGLRLPIGAWLSRTEAHHNGQYALRRIELAHGFISRAKCRSSFATSHQVTEALKWRLSSVPCTYAVVVSSTNCSASASSGFAF
ncbi:unnamed protein product [Arabis nemorensis]|uniref:Uncharacterized protein n=1 Tax=Arabis nemorensis TaxID=586526 RepID=A0A565C039_9BRAS|nr:unnamed protein product [Arabis nemorensis]